MTSPAFCSTACAAWRPKRSSTRPNLTRFRPKLGRDPPTLAETRPRPRTREAIDRSPVSVVFIDAFRGRLADVTGHAAEAPGFEGMMELVRRMSDMGGTAEAMQRRALRLFQDVLPAVYAGWVPGFWKGPKLGHSSGGGVCSWSCPCTLGLFRGVGAQRGPRWDADDGDRPWSARSWISWTIDRTVALAIFRFFAPRQLIGGCSKVGPLGLLLGAMISFPANSSAGVQRLDLRVPLRFAAQCAAPPSVRPRLPGVLRPSLVRRHSPRISWLDRIPSCAHV